MKYNNNELVGSKYKKNVVKILCGLFVMLCLLATSRMEIHAEEITTGDVASVTEAGREVPHYTWETDGGKWDGTHYYKKDGTMATDVFFCDNTYTYYLQKDGTPMKNRLTYHPNGKNVIYFDENGHEVFDNFVNVKKSISGDAVNDICYFDTFGYMYVDKITYDRAGVNLYYLNAFGVREQNGWFTFADGNIGYANADGTLMTSQYSYDQWGRMVYFRGDGKLANGLSKKGIQGFDNAFQSDASVKHVVENVYLDQLISFNPEERNHFDFNGKRYYYTTYAETLMRKVEEANTKGMEVTFILLMRGNADCANNGMMYIGGQATDPNRLYALNPSNDTVVACMHYMAQTFVKDRTVSNWIVGNEVNVPDAYNYTGTLDLQANVNIAVGNYLALYNAISGVKPSISSATVREYVSLDHSWTDNAGGYGIPGKDFLNAFWAKMYEVQPSAQWNLAYHLYAPVMQDTTSLWNRRDLTPNDENARFISAANLNVLSDYVRVHFGENCRILLSEQGFDMHAGHNVQAAALAYTFYAAQYNNMVDGVIFRAYQNDGTDGPLDLGLKEQNGVPREAFFVFQNMDTSQGHNVTDAYLGVIGAPNWESIIPNYNGQW